MMEFLCIHLLNILDNVLSNWVILLRADYLLWLSYMLNKRN